MSCIFSKLTRDVAMFLIGAGGFIHEVVIASVERPFIISACCALMGLPFVLAAQSKVKENGK